MSGGRWSLVVGGMVNDSQNNDRISGMSGGRLCLVVGGDGQW